MPKTLDRIKQLQRLRQRYARRHKEGKARMLDEFCEQHGYSRKHAIKGRQRPRRAKELDVVAATLGLPTAG